MGGGSVACRLSNPIHLWIKAMSHLKKTQTAIRNSFQLKNQCSTKVYMFALREVREGFYFAQERDGPPMRTN